LLTATFNNKVEAERQTEGIKDDCFWEQRRLSTGTYRSNEMGWCWMLLLELGLDE